MELKSDQNLNTTSPNKELTSANDAWKKTTLDMINFIHERSESTEIKDFNKLLTENNDLKKQCKMVIAALDSIISEKGVENQQVKSSQPLSCLVKTSTKKLYTDSTKKKMVSFDDEAPTKEMANRKELSKIDEDLCIKPERLMVNPNNGGDLILKNRQLVLAETNKSESSLRCFNKNNHKTQTYICEECLKSDCEFNLFKKGAVSKANCFLNQNNVTENLTKTFSVKSTETNDNNLIDKLDNLIKENTELRNHIESLDFSLMTVTKASNLQDEQLCEYNSMVISLKKSRFKLMEELKMYKNKHTNNLKLFDDIDKKVAHLKRQLDTYNELLINRHVELSDKASSTDQHLDGTKPHNDELLRKKDNYINLLQDRLCEAIVDLKNKDSEIKKHASLMENLIKQHELEIKNLEERLHDATESQEKLEEYKIKQQVTMKQLMKLIEFLQEKLEKK